MTKRKRKLPLVMRLPKGIREQPEWIFIGLVIFLLGFGYLTGLTQSVISRAIGTIGLHVWGGTLSVVGVLVVLATIRAKPSWEKLSLRLMSLTMFLYTGYLLLVTSIDRASTTIAFSVILGVVAEIRVFHLRSLIARAETLSAELESYNE